MTLLSEGKTHFASWILDLFDFTVVHIYEPHLDFNTRARWPNMCQVRSTFFLPFRCWEVLEVERMGRENRARAQRIRMCINERDGQRSVCFGNQFSA